jgi:hypothetical protein
MNEIYKYIKQLITRRQSRIVIFVLIIAPVAWAAYLRLVNGYIWTDGTGFEGKTLWDWLGLFIIPLVLAGLAIWFNKTEREGELILAEKRAEVDRKLAADRIQEETLQAYFDKITELLLDKKLLQAEPYSDLRAIAEARTLTTLRRLNGERKGILLRFLSSSRLITLDQGKTESLIRLSGADLSGIHLDWVKQI